MFERQMNSKRDAFVNLMHCMATRDELVDSLPD
jgi:hypothetical protein